LCATNGEGACDAGHVGRGQHQGVALAARRGHHHDDLAYASHVGRYGIHQQRRRIGRLAAGHVDAHAVQGRDLLTQQGAVFIAVLPALAIGLQLALVVAADALRGLLQRRTLGRRDRLEGCGEVLGLELKGRHIRHIQGVKPCGVLQHRRVAPRAHVGQDRRHSLLDRLVLLIAPMQQRLEAGFEVGLRGAQAVDRGLHVQR
jgi:hypothetical protein